jgi:hypothetical protein
MNEPWQRFRTDYQTALLSLVGAEGTLGHERINAGDWSADCAIFESPEQHVCTADNE